MGYTSVGRAGGTSTPQRVFRAVLDVFPIANLAVDQRDMPTSAWPRRRLVLITRRHISQARRMRASE